MGITRETWAADVAAGSLPGYVCVSRSTLAGYCFGARDTGEIVVLALLPEFENQGINTFSVPVVNIAVIGIAAFGFALLMTLIPSRQAANVPIAEALRYE